MRRRLLLQTLWRSGLAAPARPAPLRRWGRCCSTDAVRPKAALEEHNVDPKYVIEEEPALLEARLGFLRSIGVQDVDSVVTRHQEILGCDVAAMKPTLDYLVSLGIHELGPMVEKAPRLLYCDLDRDLRRKVVILQTLGLKRTARWLRKNPDLIDLDVETQMRPSIELLRSIRGLELPRVMDSLTTRMLRPNARLEALLGCLAELVGAGNLGKVISTHPGILAYSAKAIQHKAAWYTSAGFVDVGKMVATVPRLLSMSTETTVEAKLQFILKDMGRTMEEVEAWPQVLTYSVEHLRMRHAFLDRSGLANKYSLARMYRTALHSFCKKLAKEPVQNLQAGMGAPEPPTAAEKFYEKEAKRQAANTARGAALSEMKLLLAAAGAPASGAAPVSPAAAPPSKESAETPVARPAGETVGKWHRMVHDM